MSPQNKYLTFLRKYLEVGDALLWVLAYATYVHSVDDIIDNDIPDEKNKHRFILETFEFAECVYAAPYYVMNMNRLRPLIKMASNDFMDSVALADSDKDHHKRISDNLRCSGNAVILAVIEIEGGVELRNKASLELREISYTTHHLADGTPV